MRNIKCYLVFGALLLAVTLSNAQNSTKTKVFREILLRIDTSTFSLTKNILTIKNEELLCFKYINNESVCEVILYPEGSYHIKRLSLLESGDYQLIDSLRRFNDEYRFKVRFLNLTKTNFLSFNFSMVTDSLKNLYSVKLFPVTRTQVSIVPDKEDLYIGEEKIIDIISDNPENIRSSPEWTNGMDINYRVSANNGQLRLHLMPGSSGKKTMQLKLQTYRPYLDTTGVPVYELPVLTYKFNIKAERGRLTYLQPERIDVTMDEKSKNEGVDFQLDNASSMLLKKTYRIEAQEMPGGPLIAEIFTKNFLSDDRMLCRLRIYNYHRQSDGHLYIKDGDIARYITNFNILPQPAINKISIMRDGNDWTSNTTIYPGETVLLRIEGEGLYKTKFYFQDIQDLTTDSAERSDNVVEYKLKVPLTISRHQVDIYNFNHNTGKYLTVKEYQRNRPFDYVYLNYGSGISKKISNFKTSEVYQHTIKDIILSFNPDIIDSKEKLYGKQTFDLEIKISNSKGEILDMKTIENITVCPGENSPRYTYYDKKGATVEDISLNKILNRKTFDLNDWARIELTFKSHPDQDSKEAQTKIIDLILQKPYNFDIDVTFPAGLLTLSNNGSNSVSLSGISMAVIAQFSFYDQEKIGSFKPYKIGIGFLALNAFNFNQSSTTTRDLGIVIIGSLNPIRKVSKLSFPIYLGGGYLVNAKTWFILLGPGISVTF